MVNYLQNLFFMDNDKAIERQRTGKDRATIRKRVAYPLPYHCLIVAVPRNSEIRARGIASVSVFFLSFLRVEHPTKRQNFHHHALRVDRQIAVIARSGLGRTAVHRGGVSRKHGTSRATNTHQRRTRHAPKSCSTNLSLRR